MPDLLFEIFSEEIPARMQVQAAKDLERLVVGALSDRGLLFEGVRAYKTSQGTAIFRLQAHTDRLFDSAHIMNMKMPYSKEEINEATRAAVRENNLESAYIRPRRSDPEAKFAHRAESVLHSSGRLSLIRVNGVRSLEQFQFNLPDR